MSKISSTTWTSRKWLPAPRVPSCGRPRSSRAGNRVRVGAFEHPAALGVLDVFRAAHALGDDPAGAAAEGFHQVSSSTRSLPLLPTPEGTSTKI